MMQKKRKKITLMRVIYYCLLTFFLIIFLACAAYLGYEMLWRWEAKKEYEELGDIRDQVLSTLNTDPAPSVDPSTPTEPVPTEPTILPELQPLYEMNNDLVGWIQFPGTTIDHPVMQTPDNPDYYLKYSFEKK